MYIIQRCGFYIAASRPFDIDWVRCVSKKCKAGYLVNRQKKTINKILNVKQLSVDFTYVIHPLMAVFSKKRGGVYFFVNRNKKF